MMHSFIYFLGGLAFLTSTFLGPEIPDTVFAQSGGCNDRNNPRITVGAVNSQGGAAVSGAAIRARIAGGQTISLGSTPISFAALNANSVYEIWVELGGWEITGVMGGSDGSYNSGTRRVTLNTAQSSGVPRDYCFETTFGMRQQATGSSFALRGTAYTLAFEINWDPVAGASYYRIYMDGAVYRDNYSGTSHSSTATAGPHRLRVEAYNSSGQRISTSNEIPLNIPATGPPPPWQPPPSGQQSAFCQQNPKDPQCQEDCGCKSMGFLGWKWIFKTSEAVEAAICQSTCAVSKALGSLIMIIIERLIQAAGVSIQPDPSRLLAVACWSEYGPSN